MSNEDHGRGRADERADALAFLRDLQEQCPHDEVEGIIEAIRLLERGEHVGFVESVLMNDGERAFEVALATGVVTGTTWEDLPDKSKRIWAKFSKEMERDG